MGRAHKSRSGSLQFYPRCRAKRQYPRVKNWPKKTDTKLLGFAGYKAGMTHIMALDNYQNSPTKNMTIAIPATIIECPPLKAFSIRFYKKTPYGDTLITEHTADKPNKELGRKISLPKKSNHKNVQDFDNITLQVYTQPKQTGIGKKKPELFEIAIGGSDKNAKLEYAKSLLGKEIKVSDILKENSFVDIHAVTIGKGFQGPVKRFGITLKSHKSEKKRRSPGNLGSWTPKKVDWRVPQHGQMGYHTRTEYNKWILAINPDFIKKTNIDHYGNIKNDIVLVRGSIPGPQKRLVRIVEAIRPIRPLQIQIQK